MKVTFRFYAYFFPGRCFKIFSTLNSKGIEKLGKPINCSKISHKILWGKVTNSQWLILASPAIWICKTFLSHLPRSSHNNKNANHTKISKTDAKSLTLPRSESGLWRQITTAKRTERVISTLNRRKSHCPISLSRDCPGYYTSPLAPGLIHS